MTASVEVKGEKYIPMRPSKLCVLYLAELGDNAASNAEALPYWQAAAEMALALQCVQRDMLERFVDVARREKTPCMWWRAASNAVAQMEPIR
jgi:hypothetical protein